MVHRIHFRQGLLTGATRLSFTAVWLACSAIVASGASAQPGPGPDQAQTQGAEPVRAVAWPQIEAQHGAKLRDRGWDKRYVLDTFDHDHDGRLNPQEHRMLVVSLAVEKPSKSATGVGADTQAADSHINQSFPNVVNNPAEASNPTLADPGAADQQEAADIYDVAPADLEGRAIFNQNGERLGKVRQVVVNPRSSALGLVLQAGGFLGVGGTRVYVPLSDVELSKDLDLVWKTETDSSGLKEMAGYQEEDYLPVDTDQFGSLHTAREELLSTARKD